MAALSAALKKPAENRPELEKPGPASGQQRGESIRQTGGAYAAFQSRGVTFRYAVAVHRFGGGIGACAVFRGLGYRFGRPGKGGGSRWEGKLEEKGMG